MGKGGEWEEIGERGKKFRHVLTGGTYYYLRTESVDLEKEKKKGGVLNQKN